MPLLDYQARNAVPLFEALRRDGAAIDGSDPGTGKTYTICGVAEMRNEMPLVICPAVVVSAWKRVAAELGGDCMAINYEMVRTGRTIYGHWEHIEGMEATRAALKAITPEYKAYCAAFLKVGKGLATNEEITAFETQYPRDKFHPLSREYKKLKATYDRMKARRKFIWNKDEIAWLVFDEVHYCKSATSENAKMLIAAKRQGIPTLVASATAAEDPLQMRALGYVLGLHKGTDFWEWAKKHGCRPAEFGGMEFIGSSKMASKADREKGQRILAALHAEIYPRLGVRTTREDLGDRFPECNTSAELYDLLGHEKVDQLWAEIDHCVKLIEKGVEDSDLEHPFTRLLRARQKLELLKVPLLESLIEMHIENGLSVAVFVNFKETLAELGRRRKTTCTIEGDQHPDVRAANIADFQADRSREIHCNLKAGGVGVSLHDLHGNHARISLICPGHSAVDLSQCLGRIWRQFGKTKVQQRIVLTAKTVEEKIHKQLNHALKNLSILNDGDLKP